MLRGTEDLPAVAAVVLAPVEGVELLVALEAVGDVLVPDPLVAGTEGGLDYLLYLLVHINNH